MRGDETNGRNNQQQEGDKQDLSRRSRRHKLALNMAQLPAPAPNLENLEDIVRLRQGQLGCRLRVTQHAISLDGLEARRGTD